MLARTKVRPHTRRLVSIDASWVGRPLPLAAAARSGVRPLPSKNLAATSSSETLAHSECRADAGGPYRTGLHPARAQVRSAAIGAAILVEHVSGVEENIHGTTEIPREVHGVRETFPHVNWPAVARRNRLAVAIARPPVRVPLQ